MAKNAKWSDDYWLLLMQIYLQKPVGIKPTFHRKMVDLSLELHMPPNFLFNKMCQIANLETPRIEHIWETYGRNPKKLARAVSLWREMRGYGHADAFYEGVEVQETFERDFKPVNKETTMTPVMMTLILDHGSGNSGSTGTGKTDQGQTSGSDRNHEIVPILRPVSEPQRPTG